MKNQIASKATPVSASVRRTCLALAACAFAIANAGTAKAQSVWTGTTTSGTSLWSDSANWLGGVPASGETTALQYFSNTTTPLPTGTITANNDNAGTFTLNRLVLRGLSPATTATTSVVINGGDLAFAGSAPALTLDGLSSTGLLNYTIANNIAFNTDTTLGGNGTAGLTLSGALSGNGTLTKAGSSTVQLNGNSSSTFSGGLVIGRGTVQVNGGLGGRLPTSQSIVFAGGGGLTYAGNGVNTSGTFGAVEFRNGTGTLASSRASGETTFLVVASASAAQGATRRFSVGGGSNGSNTGVRIANQAVGFMGANSVYGSGFAFYLSGSGTAGHVGAATYGTTANTAALTGNVVSFGTNAHIQYTPTQLATGQTSTGTIGSSTVTVTTPGNFSVGSILAGTGVPTWTYITAISGSTLTLSKPLTGANPSLTSYSAVSAQPTATIASLVLAANLGGTVLLDSGATLTISSGGIWRIGNISTGSVIAGGAGITTGGTSPFVYYSDNANGGVSIQTPILATTTGGLIVAGAGAALQVAAANTFSGGIWLNSGVLEVAAAETPGTSGPLGATGVIRFYGGQLRYSSANTFDYSSRFSTDAGQAFSVNTNGQNVTWATSLTSVGGSLTKASIGNLTLSASNAFTSATVSSGLARVGDANALGSGTVTLSGGGLASADATDRTITNPIRITADANFNALGAGRLTLAGPVELPSTGVTLTQSSGNGALQISGAITGSGTLSLDNGSSVTLSGNNSGWTPAAISLAANAGLTLNSSNAFGSGAGPIGIGGNTLVINADMTGPNARANSFNLGGALTFSGSQGLTILGAVTASAADRTLTNNIQSDKLLTLAGPVLLRNGTDTTARVVTFAGTGNTTISGTIGNGGVSGSASILKSGSGILRLTAANTYTGTTGISGGILAISSTDSLPGWNTTGRYSVAAGATLAVGDAVTDGDLNTIRTSGNFVANAGIGFDVGAGGRTYSGAPIANTAAGLLNLVKIGSGTLTMNVANTYTGTTAINEGMLKLGVAGAIPSTGTVVLSGNGQLGFGSLVTSATLGVLTGSTAIGLVNDASQGVALTLGNGNGSSTYAGQFTGAGSLAKIGTGTLTLSGNNTYSGSTTLGGGVLSLGSAGALAGGGNILFTGGTMQFGAANQADYSSRIVSSTAAITLDTNGQNVTFTSPLAASNTAGLTKLGSGTLTVAGNSLYSGTTTISAGVLRAGGNSAFGTNSVVSLANAAGAALDLNGFSQSMSALSGGGALGGNVIMSGGSLSVGSANTTGTFFGGFTGTPGTLVKQGIGILTLNGTTSSFSGVTLEAGGLTVSPTSTSTYALGTITRSVGSGLSLQRGTGVITVDPATSVTSGMIGPWAITGTGTNMTYATHTSGTIDNYTASLTAANATNLPNDATANVVLTSATGTTPSVVVANTIRFSGTGSPNTTLSGSLTVNGLMYAGNTTSAIWTLGGSSGVIRIPSSGELVVAANNAASVTIDTTIRESAPGQSLTFISQGAALSLRNGSGASPFLITGTINSIGGDLRLHNTGTFGTVNLSANNNLVAGISMTASGVSQIGSISGVGSTFTKQGPGTVRLLNTSSYTGISTIENGTLEVPSLPSIGTAGGLGAPTTAANGTIAIGSGTTTGVLRYVGGGDTTNRVVNLAGSTGGATIDASGSGALVFTSAFTATGAGSKTLTLTGSSTAANEVGVIPNTSSGSLSVNKTGSGLWRLTGASSYGGQLTVSDGTIVIAAAVGSSNNSPFGSNSGTATLPVIGNSSGTASGTVALLAEGVTVSRGFFIAASGSGGSQVVVLGGTGTGMTNFDTSAVRLGRSVTLQASTGGTVEFASDWRDSLNGLSPQVAFTIGSTGNAGTVIFGSNLPDSITAVDIVAGTLRSNASDRLAPATPVTVGSLATLDISGATSISQQLGNLTFTGNSGSVTSGSGNGTLRLWSGSMATVTVTGTGHLISAAMALDDAASFNVSSGGRLRVSGVIATGSAGAQSLTKSGGGILELSGANTYSGDTTVSDGTFVVNGSLGSGALSVAAAATLMGSGTIGGAATIAGIHSPGNSPGVETFLSNLTYSSGSSQVIWELWGNTDTAGDRGSVYDGIDVNGNLDFAGATSLSLVFTGTGSSVDWTDPFWGSDQTWTLFDVAGTTSNLINFSLMNSPASWFDANGLAFASSTRKDNTFTVSQQGSDVLIQYTVVVPEPASLALAAIGIAAAALAARRRR
jgi:autotransporter-associated beta strand protein